MGQVRDIWLCLGVLCLKSQIPSTPPKRRRAGKLQINFKFQYSTRGASACAARDLNRFSFSFFKIMEGFGILNFGHCYLFVICYLLFGI
jgi:hypothetical protein